MANSVDYVSNRVGVSEVTQNPVPQERGLGKGFPGLSVFAEPRGPPVNTALSPGCLCSLHCHHVRGKEIAPGVGVFQDIRLLGD